MAEKDLAVMMLTHNHYETVNEILGKDLLFYKNCGIDVYVCDDSDDDETKKVVESFVEKGFDNIFWVDAHASKNGDDKYYRILKGEFRDKDYKYIFPMKDRAYFSERVINTIMRAIADDFDVIMPVQDLNRWEFHIPRVKYWYNDPVEFFSHYGQLTTNWRAIVYKVKTMLAPERIKRFETEYHIGSDCPFNQPVTVFAGLAELDNPRIYVIHGESAEDMGESATFNAGSAWVNRVYKLWLDQWVAAVFSLPAIYDRYKANVVKAETNLGILFGSCDTLLLHNRLGLLTQEVFDKYRGTWEMVSNVPVEWVDMIIQGRFEELKIAVCNEIIYSLRDHDYEKAYYIVTNNQWLTDLVDDFALVSRELLFYRLDIYYNGFSDRMDGVTIFQDIVDKVNARNSR